MALPKKGIRKIVVNDIEYVWTVRLTHYCEINLTIALASNQKRMLRHSTNVVERYSVLEEREDGVTLFKSSGQLNSITSKMVRELILAALKNGWEQAEDGVFPMRNFIFDMEKAIESKFEVGLLQQAIEMQEYHRINYLDIEMWTYSPNKLPEEFFHVFYLEDAGLQYGLNFFLLKFTQNEEFILKMLLRYSRFLRIPQEKLPKFLSGQKFTNKSLAPAEIETHLLAFLRSKNAPFCLRHLKIESANYVFIESLSYGLIAKTEKGILGFIWDNAG